MAKLINGPNNRQSLNVLTANGYAKEPCGFRKTETRSKQPGCCVVDIHLYTLCMYSIETAEIPSRSFAFLFGALFDLTGDILLHPLQLFLSRIEVIEAVEQLGRSP